MQMRHSTRHGSAGQGGREGRCAFYFKVMEK